MIHINACEALCHGENGHRPLLSGYEPEMSDMDKVVLGANFQVKWRPGGPSIDLCILSNFETVLFFPLNINFTCSCYLFSVIFSPFWHSLKIRAFYQL